MPTSSHFPSLAFAPNPTPKHPYTYFYVCLCIFQRTIIHLYWIHSSFFEWPKVTYSLSRLYVVWCGRLSVFPVHNKLCLGQCLLPVVKGWMGPCKVGGAEPRGLWYVTIRSVPVSQLHTALQHSGGFIILVFFFQESFRTNIWKCYRPPLAVLNNQGREPFTYVGMSYLKFTIGYMVAVACCFDHSLGLGSFPTSPPEEADNAQRWDWCELATAAGSRDRSVQIQWSLCHVCQQSHRLNKLSVTG